ncbi:MAG: hypothetical protein AVDCRST_MAG68-5639 [uncultured Gemmatimonadetes bacterium]|uniref:Uncharacterized protein n=1 Tax=uncultured Gemmatimonadota bacterium TaxID=203437 RepID=A0A6J4MYH0_9BACT|nr:MAG: hypothetical protein AVDCRST_MAG68-5639 [uncultured Gemmatimonadota bacterium]
MLREAKLEREVARLRAALATAESQATPARFKRRPPDVLRGTPRSDRGGRRPPPWSRLWRSASRARCIHECRRSGASGASRPG